MDSLRQMDWASRETRKRQKQLQAITQELSAKLGRAPTESELADALGVGMERWRQIMAELRAIEPLSAEGLGAQPPRALAEFPARRDTEPGGGSEREQLRTALAQAVNELPEGHRRVVFLYYTRQMTLKEIGETLKLPESRVAQIRKTALARLARGLRSVGIEPSAVF